MADEQLIARSGSADSEVRPEAGRAEAGRAQAGRPEDGRAQAGRPGRRRVRSVLLAVALVLPFAGVVAFLIAFQPFAAAAGGCGGG